MKKKSIFISMLTFFLSFACLAFAAEDENEDENTQDQADQETTLDWERVKPKEPPPPPPLTDEELKKRQEEAEKKKKEEKDKDRYYWRND